MSLTVTTRAIWCLRLACLFFACVVRVEAQATSETSPSEDVEPRQIGALGTMFVGFGGYVDQFFVSDRAMPLNYTADFDLGRFVTPRIVLHGGLHGAGSAGGDNEDDLPTGTGALAIHATGGARFYFRPQSLASLYVGAEYWIQLTRQATTERGTVLGTIGFQGAVSSRASLFLEGGYGLGLGRDDGELPHRLTGRLGVRLKF